MGYSKHVGRVGALAFALGVGFGLGAPGTAWADETGGESSSSSSESSSERKMSKPSRDSSNRADDKRVAADQSEKKDDGKADRDSVKLTVRSAPDTDARDEPDEPDVPVDSPAEWLLVAAARRQIGQADTPTNADPRTSLRTYNGLFTPNVYGRVRATDPDGDTLTYSASDTAKGGTVNITSRGSFTYAPSATARHGAAAKSASAEDRLDTFTVTVSDGRGGAVAVPVSVRINGANGRPTGVRATGVQSNPNSGSVTGRIVATDPDNDTFTYRVPTTTARGEVAIDAEGRFTYTPTEQARAAATRRFAPFWDRIDSFRVTVDDGHGGTTAAIIRVDIPPMDNVNRPPTTGTYTVGQPDSATGRVTGTATAVDPDGDTLVYSGTTTTAKGEVIVGVDGAFVYTPTDDSRHRAAAVNATATDKADTFEITADDGFGGTTTIPVSVAVAPQNRAPLVTDMEASPPDPQSGEVRGSISASDPDGDLLSFRGSAGRGSVTVAPNGSFGYTPSREARAAAALGGPTTDDVLISVTDGHGGSVTRSIAVSILPGVSNPVNGSPTDGAFVVTEVDPTTGKVTGTVTATDPDGDSLTFGGPSVTPKGTLAVSQDGTFTYVPNAVSRHKASAISGPAADKVDNWVVSVSDGRGGTLTVPVSVAISPQNNAPLITGLSAEPPDSQLGTVNGTVSVVDPDGDPLTFSGSATRGSVTVNPSGSFAYTPTEQARAAAASGGPIRDDITVTVSDGHGGSTTRSISVAIQPAAYAPLTVPGIPGAFVTGPGGTAFQLVYQLPSESSVAATTVVVRLRPDGASTASQIIPGIPVGPAPIARPDGGFSFVAMDTAERSRIVNITADGVANVIGDVPGGNAYYANDGTMYQITVLRDGPEEPSHGFEIRRVGTAGQLSTHTYTTDAEHLALLGGSPVVNTNGSLFVPVNIRLRLDVGDDESHIRSHAAILVISPEGASTVYAATRPNGVDVTGESEVRGLAVGNDGTVYFAADTFRLSTDFVAIPSTRILTIGPAGIPSVFDLNHRIDMVHGGGSLPVMASWIDDEGAAQSVLLTPQGATPANFSGMPRVGPDGLIYSLESTDSVLVVAGPNSTERYSLGGRGSSDPRWMQFSSDGTLFAVVIREDGTAHIAIPILGKSSSTVPAQEFPQGGSSGTIDLRVFGDTAVLVSVTGTGTHVVAINSFGQSLGDMTFGRELGVLAPGQFGVDVNGSVQLALIQGAGGSAATTTVWTVDGETAEQMPERPGIRPTYWAEGVFYQVSYSGNSTDNFVTEVDASAVTPTIPRNVPTSISTNLDPSTGIVSGKIELDPSLGDIVNWAGATDGPLGQVIVNGDGTFRFTPSAAARQFAEQSGKLMNVMFFVEATNSEGKVFTAPVNASLIPTSFPSTPVSSQVTFPPLTLNELRSDPGSLGEWYSPKIELVNTQAYYVDSDRNLVTEGCEPSNPCLGLSFKWDYYVFKLTRTGHPDIYTGYDEDEDEVVAALPDVYVVSTIHFPGQPYRHGHQLVTGFRKLNFGDTVYFKNDMINSDRMQGNVFQQTLTEHVIELFAPGTFPEERYYLRDDGVGGNIFNNEFELNDALQLQDYGFREAMSWHMTQRGSVEGALDKAGNTVAMVGPSIVFPAGAGVRLSLKGKIVFKAVRVAVDGSLEVIDDEDDLRSALEHQPNQVFLIEGPPVGPPPTIGFPQR